MSALKQKTGPERTPGRHPACTCGLAVLAVALGSHERDHRATDGQAIADQQVGRDRAIRRRQLLQHQSQLAEGHHVAVVATIDISVSVVIVRSATEWSTM